MYNINIIQHHDYIWELENFITNEEIALLNDAIDHVSENEWQDVGGRNYNINNFKTEIIPTFRSLEEKLMKYFKNYTSYLEVIDLQRLKDGMYMSEHQDFDPSGTNTNIVFGAVFYVNDNFTGGELYYPELDYKIKPKAKSVIVHKWDYWHSVLPVETGTRYMFTIFIKGNENTSFIKNF
jgi:prolyl 4-hydroxylase